MKCMPKLKLSTKQKGVLSVVALLLSVLFFAVLLLNKQNMENYISKIAKQGNTTENNLTTEAKLDALYNYSENNKTFQFTFLEFGAKGCSACMRMEGVMDEIRKNHSDKINVVFYNVLLPENQEYMSYYGVATIPTQIFLDSNGREISRHSGYISTNEIYKSIQIDN